VPGDETGEDGLRLLLHVDEDMAVEARLTRIDCARATRLATSTSNRVGREPEHAQRLIAHPPAGVRR